MHRTILSLSAGTLLFFGLTACGGDEDAVEEAPHEEPEAEPEPEPEPEPAKPAGKVLPVAKINEMREDKIGKSVSVSGFYQGTTKQGDPITQINISITGDADGEGGKILCVGTPESEPMWDGFSMKDEIVVTGKVAERDWFGGALLEECVKAEAGDDAGGDDEGGDDKAGKAKGGKQKAGKRKAH